jgi:hypothetical protein
MWASTRQKPAFFTHWRYLQFLMPTDYYYERLIQRIKKTYRNLTHQIQEGDNTASMMAPSSLLVSISDPVADAIKYA